MTAMTLQPCGRCNLWIDTDKDRKAAQHFSSMNAYLCPMCRKQQRLFSFLERDQTPQEQKLAREGRE